MNKPLVILIPTHRAILTPDEHISVDRVLRLCPDTEIRFVCPDTISRIEDYDSIPVEHFDSSYFRSISGYNELMLCEEFYRRFEEYRYMLIYQTDAYLFRNELDDWCRRDYPYVGAPWLIKRKYRGLGRILLYLRALPKRLLGRPFLPLDFGGKVGNGGLSLRRVADFITMCRCDQQTIRQWLELSHTIREYNEDCYWASRPDWRYPSADEALRFAVDLGPADALTQLHGELPMGCHGWTKPAYRSFWAPYILTHQHTIQS